MLKIRRPLGRLIFNMGIAIPGKTVFLIETAPSSWNGTNLLHFSQKMTSQAFLTTFDTGVEIWVIFHLIQKVENKGIVNDSSAMIFLFEMWMYR